MGQPVVTGGKAMCSMGPGGMFNISAMGNVMIENKPILTTKDTVPFMNVSPAGVMCQSMANPMVASATAAAMGVLTPQPCVPNFVGMWLPGTINCKCKFMGLVDSSCSLMCAYAGKLSITFAGATRTTVK